MATTPKPRVAKSGRPDSVNNAAGLRITTMNQQPQAAGKSRTEVYEWGKGRQIFEHPRLLMGKRITSISCGGDHAAAITGTYTHAPTYPCIELGVRVYV